MVFWCDMWLSSKHDFELCGGKDSQLWCCLVWCQLGGFVLSLCPDTVWDYSSVTNQSFVRDEEKMQNFCTIIGQDHSGAIL